MRNSLVVGLALVAAGVLFLVLSSFSFAGVAFVVIGGFTTFWSALAMLRHWHNNRGDGGESTSWAAAALARRRQAARRERRHRTA